MKGIIPYFNPCFMSRGRLNSWVVSHSALIIGTLRHALGHEFEPRWRQTLFWTQAQHLCFIHDYIWFIWFDTIIYLSNLSSELWNRKLKIKEIYFKKKSLYLVTLLIKYNNACVPNTIVSCFVRRLGSKMQQSRTTSCSICPAKRRATTTSSKLARLRPTSKFFRVEMKPRSERKESTFQVKTDLKSSTFVVLSFKSLP